jgi:hypothetical protein
MNIPTHSDLQNDSSYERNPAAEGFNISGSDPQAITIADEVMEAMGGREAWDDIEVLSWDFFGARSLRWNKRTGDLNIIFSDDSTEIDMNLEAMEGMVFLTGNPLLSPDSLQSWMELGRSIWRNDSYWLIMPFKMKDSGVTLTYKGMEKVNGVIDSHVLGLTFNQVGDTPQNRYDVYVDARSHLVNQWAFFKNQGDTVPLFTLPWTDYAEYNGILLSSHRGDKVLGRIEALKSYQ